MFLLHKINIPHATNLQKEEADLSKLISGFI